MNKKLREGFSTGSAATAAAMVALQLLLAPKNEAVPSHMYIPLPPQEGMARELRLHIPILSAHLINENEAVGMVEKDGGDDPDATHKAHIHAHVRLSNRNKISIDGGKGVGRFTLPGLPLPVGEAAINPAPRKQICAGLEMISNLYGYVGGIEVCISVPRGEEIAKKTFNARLGILGGISILGTQGTVKPFSHAAWKATISQGMQVAASNGCKSICLSTGRRSERLVLAKYAHLPLQCAVQVADFAEFSLQEAAKHNFEQIIWACFFGKLVKLAQGHAYTHARSAELDFNLLASWCSELEPQDREQITKCVTANHALEIILANKNHMDILKNIVRRAAKVAENFANRPVQMHLFHLDGRSLVDFKSSARENI